jgi:hypothetical protein
MIKNAKLRTVAMVAVGAIIAAAPRLANACATCGLADGDVALHAYKTSVLFMLVSPYVSFFAIGGVVYYIYRRSIRQDREAATKR